jgi:EAL domain-containing protein (putative c-di-GMP-specific phosphodiesterase class I)
MYTAKRGGGGWAVYSPDHDRSSVERLTLLTELRKAIEQDELELHFQPVIDVGKRNVVGCEALIRWHHPTYGRLNPSLIIELAELSGLILPLTRWVATVAMNTLKQWIAEDLDLTIAINLSVRNLYDRKLVSWLNDQLDEHGIPHEQLKVELTESEVMDDPLLAIEVLGALREIGVTTSVDDFGTGYSSLQYLSRLPVSEIKIDQSFVANMIETEEDLTIVNTVIDLAHNLGMTVLAEGVEDDLTLKRLEELGCDRAQGYLIGKPSPIADFLDVVAQWESSAEM